jgi:hypothetical protein
MKIIFVIPALLLSCSSSPVRYPLYRIPEDESSASSGNNTPDSRLGVSVHSSIASISSDGLSDEDALGVSRHSSELSDDATVDSTLLQQDIFDFDRKYSPIQEGRKELTEKSPRARKQRLVPYIRESMREPRVLESTKRADIFPPPPRAGGLHILGGQSLLDDHEFNICIGGEWTGGVNRRLDRDLFDIQSNTQPIGEELRVERLMRDTKPRIPCRQKSTGTIVEGVEKSDETDEPYSDFREKIG